MVNMADYLRQLEACEDLEGKIIRETKVYKVLKAIIKLDNIPQEELHNFKQRSSALLSKWNAVLAAADGEPTGKTTPAATNGVKADDEKSESAKADTPVVEKKEDEPKESVREPVASWSMIGSSRPFWAWSSWDSLARRSSTARRRPLTTLPP